MTSYFGWPRSSPYARVEYWSVTSDGVTYHYNRNPSGITSNLRNTAEVKAQIDRLGNSPREISLDRVISIRDEWGRNA